MTTQRSLVPATRQGMPTPAGVLQRKCACGQHTGGGAECKDCKRRDDDERLRGSRMQAKLALGSPGNPFEREADRIAETVAGGRFVHVPMSAGLAGARPVLRKPADAREAGEAPAVVEEVLRAPGRPLSPAVRGFMEPRFGHDFSNVRVHRDEAAMKSAREINALAYTVGSNLVFGAGQYAPETSAGRKLLAHELAHVLQQKSAPYRAVDGSSVSDSPGEEYNADKIANSALAGASIGSIVRSTPKVQRRAAPYIKKVSVHLSPPQSADLEWEGTPPAAPGSDHFTVSTGKGYGDPDDPPGTCRRSCCKDPLTQCAPPWNQPGRVGACCTYYGNSFWTGTPLDIYNGWKWWTPIQPYYSSRGIALHQHTEVTGQPIGHGCVRMDDENAHRIYDFSNGRRTNVTIDGRAAPVACEEDRKCGETSGSSARGETEGDRGGSQEAVAGGSVVPGLEGVLS